jgi:hypothetical protein
MANLLFSSGFEGGVSLAAPSGEWQNVVGQDAATGANWPANLWGGNSSIQTLTGGGSLSSTISNSIDNIPGPDGSPTQALHLSVLQKASDVTQDPLLLQVKQEPGDFYISEWVKLPANLGQLLGPGGWLTLNPAWKTTGDFRSVTNIEVDGSGTPYWHMKWDNLANGSLPAQTFWDDYNRSVPVPQDEWFHVEFFTHRSDSDGRVWLKIDGQTVFDHTGDNIGVNNAPIDRIFLANPYASKPIDIYVDNIQIWDGVPSGGSATPAPAPVPTPSPTPVPGSSTVGSGSDKLVLKVSQDAYQGDAQFMVSVDGEQVGGTFTAHASHAAGQSDTLTLQGDWGVGNHTVTIDFLNDAWAGTSSTDRNLYVDSASYNGAAVSGAKLALYSGGPASFGVTDSTPAVAGASAAPTASLDYWLG